MRVILGLDAPTAGVVDPGALRSPGHMTLA
ncbi:hypothetical protein BJ981_005494 [Sphaerisporangium krabiense]|uniref:Uncharacterized protein n=1 Tax=Sphaerisporangium krabiense TaxID=763782 RepID=A0A7W8Z9I9_9ACTN|nr:hypothetical protein [Sphaerisporangium krabiense]